MNEPTLYQTGTDEELYDLVFAEYGATSTAIVRAVKKWLKPVEPDYIGAVLRECLPLISDNQVADVIEALGAGIGGGDE